MALLRRYFAVAENESIGRVRYQMMEVPGPCLCRTTARARRRSAASFSTSPTARFMPSPRAVAFAQKMLQPCGPPPAKEDDDDDE